MKSEKLEDLKRLVEEVLHCTADSPRREDKITQIVHLVFPGCRFNYACKDTPSSNIYQGVDEQVKQQLSKEIASDINNSVDFSNRFKKEPDKWLSQWLSELRKRALRVVLDDGNLHALARLAQQMEEPQQRSFALTRLRQALYESGKIEFLRSSLRKKRSNLSPHDFEEIYYDALNHTWNYFCENIDSYNFSKFLFAHSLRFIVHRRFLTEYGKFIKRKKKESEFPNGEPEKAKLPYKEPAKSLSDDLREFFIHDPRFDHIHMQDYPWVTLKIVALELLDGKGWREISVKFKVRTLQAVRQFFNNNIRQFRDDFEPFRDLLDD